MLDRLLAELGTRLGLESLGLEANGTCQLIVDEARDLVIESIPGEEAAFVYATIAQGPEGSAEELYRRLLQAHLFGAETGDAYFAVNPDREILLIKRISLNGLDCDGFQGQLQEFLNWTVTWQDRLAEDAGLPSPGNLDPLMKV